MLVMASYNVVDRMFVGRGVGSMALSGIAVSFPLTVIIMGFAQLVAVGNVSVLSIKLGEKDYAGANRILSNALTLSLIIAALLGAGLYIFKSPLITFFGGTGAAHEYAMEYLSIIIPAIPLQFIPFALNGAIRAEGNPKMALYSMLISGVLNIILNPVFIMVLHLGIRGSALATVISQSVSTIIVVGYFMSKRSHLKIRGFAFDTPVISKIISIGVSPLITQIAGSAILFVYNRTLFSYGGNDAIAIFSVGMGISMMLTMPIFGLNQGIQPIIGYNYGAKDIARVKETFKKGVIIATTICVVGFSVIMVFGSGILHLFIANDEKLVRLGVHALRVSVLLLPLNGIQFVSWAYFQAVGRPKQAIVLTLTKQILLIIPLILILPRFFQLEGAWLVQPVADGIAALLTFTLLFFEGKRLNGLQNTKIEAGDELLWNVQPAND
jgi:putative MATE family efflux protein